MAIDRRLRLGVMQFCGGPHQDAMKLVRAFTAVRADHHPHGKCGTALMRLERAEIVRNPLRQHRNDAVGEIGRVAARECLAV
jgi:hypothetical protein